MISGGIRYENDPRNRLERCQLPDQPPTPTCGMENRLKEHLESDTVCYAVCRFFVKNPTLCRTYTWESYQLRLAGARAAGPDGTAAPSRRP